MVWSEQNDYILHYSQFNLSNSMEESPSLEAKNRSANQVIPRLLPKQEVHYHVHNSSYPSHPLSLRTTLILSYHLRLDLPSGPLPLGLANQLTNEFNGATSFLRS